MDDATLERFADVIVGFGANVQPGQIVAVSCEPGKEFMVRAIAASAYRHGAKFVDVQYFDPWVKRARIEHAREEDLDFIPDWHGKRLLALGDVGAARVGLSGRPRTTPPSPGRRRVPRVQARSQQAPAPARARTPRRWWPEGPPARARPRPWTSA